jgi:hypothetical protein
MVTISVHSTRGACVDPPVQSYGNISLVKTIASGTGSDGETDVFSAAFPSGPGLKRPAAAIPQPGTFLQTYTPLPSSISCPVPGYSQLSVGAIQVQGPNGQVTVQPTTAQDGSVSYSNSLPAGFIVPGQYSIEAAGSGSIRPFSGNFTVGSPIQVQTDLAAGSMIPDDSGGNLTIQWTGGVAGSVVSVALQENTTPVFSEVGYAQTGSQSLTFGQICLAYDSLVCNLGVSGVDQIVVNAGPNPAAVPSLTAPGITGSIQILWDYSYLFAGLNP